YINNFLWIIEVLKGIREEYGDIECTVYRKNEVQAAGIFPYFAKKDRFVDSLVEKYCRENNVKVTVIKEPGTDTAAGGTQSRTGGIKTILKSAVRTLLKRKLKKLSRFPGVFIAAPSYNLDRVCRDIQNRFPNVRAVSHSQAPGSAKGYLKLFLKELKKALTGKSVNGPLIPIPVKLFEPVEQNTGLEAVKESIQKFAAVHRDQFIYENCPFWDIFNRKVETDLLPAIAGLLDAAAGQRAFLGYLKPKLMMSPVSTGEYQSWAEVSRSLDIPALVIPQKTLLKPSNEFARIEEFYIGRAQVTDTFANAAAQSPLITDYLKWSGYNGNIIETGNLIFARLDAGKRKARRKIFLKEIGGNERTKIIVWAPSMKTRKSRRFYVLESIDELMSAMSDVFETVARMKDVHLVFRIHPGDAITKAEIYDLLSVPANVSVSDSGIFEDVVSAADLLISFSSTAVQEALINFIPIVLYDKWNRYNHLDADEVKNGKPGKMSPVYYIHDRNDLSSSLEWILNEHTTKDVPPEIFEKTIFLKDNDKFKNFMNFVEQCITKGE
ncbi:MAG: hypothetical protein GY950_25735, partial [bacterium]|nr:hypothetical protein [bacterium]